MKDIELHITETSGVLPDFISNPDETKAEPQREVPNVARMRKKLKEAVKAGKQS